MVNPVGRLPLSPAQLQLLQSRPAAPTNDRPAASLPTVRERPIPPASSGPNGGGPLRGRLVDILA
jgi:hypothetical protein